MKNQEHPIQFLEIYFDNLEDPRLDRRKRHDLLDILGLSILAIVCGADTWVGVEEYGKAKEDFLRQYLALPNGIPSHDTIGRVFSILDSEALEQGFVKWTKAISELNDGEVVAIDGKQLRRSYDRQSNKSAIHMVSAWACTNQVSLGQIKVDEKSNEITAIPKLLEVLDLSGCIVTIDAMGTQKEIAGAIRDQQADYLLALKANHVTLYEEVSATFRHLKDTRFTQLDEQWHKEHGRIECRRCWVMDLNAPDFDWILSQDLEAWSDLNTIVMIEAHRWLNQKEEHQQRYYLSSLKADQGPALFNRVVRTHWNIENNCHWVLDVVFKEDYSRVRKGFADQNFSIFRRLALNLLKREKSTKVGIQNKRLKAAWNNKYLFKVLNG